MITREFEVKVVNVDALDEMLKKALPGICDGFTWIDGKLTVYLSEKANKSDLALVEQIVKDHDPSKLSESEQKAQLAKLDLDARRIEIGDGVIDDKKYPDPLLGELAKRIAVLELEVRQLRGR